MTVLFCLYFAFISGLARGSHHAFRDYRGNSRWKLWLSDSDWYNGAGRWNQSWPWSTDFAHLMMHLQVIGLALWGWACMYLPRPGWAVWVLPVLAWWIEGRGFTLMYHVILPAEKRYCDYTFIRWLRGWIM